MSPDARDAALAMAYHALGRDAESDAAVARLTAYTHDLWPTGIAQVYAYRGDRDKALEWLKRALELRDPEWMMSVRSDLLVAGLRGDPRYRALLSNMHLAD